MLAQLSDLVQTRWGKLESSIIIVRLHSEPKKLALLGGLDFRVKETLIDTDRCLSFLLHKDRINFPVSACYRSKLLYRYERMEMFLNR